MAFAPGDVVFLKSGGSPMTVTAVGEDSVDCLWLGEEGELFRESIPSVALMIGSDPVDEDEDDEDNEDEPGDDATDRRKRGQIGKVQAQGGLKTFLPSALRPTLNA